MHPFFCPTCLWCGARLIQRIQALRTRRPAEDIKTRCRTVLNDWMAFGHAEASLRALAGEATVPLQPTGPDAPGESEPQPPTKPLSASKKRSSPRVKD